MKTLLTFFCSALCLQAVELLWDANTESNLAGYRAYYGSASRQYSTVVDVGNFTQVTLLTMPRKTYYAVTAYDSDGLESDFSDEVSHTPSLLYYNGGTNHVPYEFDPSLWRNEFQWPFFNSGEQTHVFDSGGNQLPIYDEPPGSASSRIVEAWTRQSHARDIVVALIDFDFDIYHDSLGDRFIPGVRIVQGIESPLAGMLTARDAHGTLGAGVIGGNGTGVSGICRDGVKLLPICPVLHSDFALAIRYAVDHGARIINFPFASAQGPLESWRSAIEYARAAGVLVVCSAANPPWPSQEWPADWVPELDNIVLVGGFTRAGAQYASGGYQDSTGLIHVLAPARLIVTTYPGNEYRYSGGTTLAAAFVSGSLALNYQQHPTEDYRKAKRRLIATADERRLDTTAMLDWKELLFTLPAGRWFVESSFSLLDPTAWIPLTEFIGPGELSITVDTEVPGRYFRATLIP